MKKSLRSKILLCVLAGGVLAANSALAAEYTEVIDGANDTSYSEIKTQDGNNYTYNFSDGDILKLYNTGAYIYAVNIRNNDVDTLTLNNGLDISITVDNGAVYTAKGLFIDSYNQSNKLLDRSDGGDINITVLNDIVGTMVDAVHASGNNNVIKTGDGDIDINIGSTSNPKGYGLVSENGGKLISGNGDITIRVSSSNISGSVFAEGLLAIEGGYIKKDNGKITVTAEGSNQYTTAFGIEEYSGGKIEVGTGDIKASAINNSNINNSESYAVGIYAADNVTKGDGKIESKAEGGAYTTAYGVFARSYDNDAVVNLGVVDVSAEAVYDGKNDPFAVGIYADGSNANDGIEAVVNMDGGLISATANEDQNTAYSIYTNEGTVNVNQSGGNDVVIDGNVFDYYGAVNLNLDTANSVLNAAVQTSGGTLTLNLANSATWNNKGTSLISTLTMDGGIINQNAAQDITINSYSGTGSINYLAEADDADGVVSFANTGDIIIKKAAAGSVANLSVTNDTIDTLDIAKTEENLNAIANKLFYTANNGSLSGTVTLAEGLITPAASGELLFYETDTADGHVAGQGYANNITGGNRVTETMDAMKNISATNIIAWRQEDSTLSQRLGELRHSDGGQGIWVRMSRGEFEYGGEYKNQYNYFQMGYDWAAKDWHYGAAVSYNDGQTTYTHGKGENSSTSLSLYGTWLGSKGHYADIVLKQGRLSNDFDIYTSAGHTSGDYDAWGTSLSGEYGRKVDLNDGWFITPQAQLTLMRIGGEDYTTNNGIKVHQDTLTSAVGRVGFEVGKQIDGRGSVCAKASLLHDFAGSADTYLSLNGLSNSYRQDISDTWCEAGIGFNYKTSANSYIYADVVKTFGGDVETPWQWNAGMRWMF